MARNIVILESGSQWTVPADWSDDNVFTCIGGGGAGGWGAGAGAGGQGGGGGACARTVNLGGLTPGQVLTFSVGAGGPAVAQYGSTGTPGGPTWISTTGAAPNSRNEGCLAQGGGGGIYSNTTDNRGNADTSVGDIRYFGGIGGSPSNMGGGGGGAAGPFGPGGAGGSANGTASGGGGGGNGNGSAGGVSPPYGGNNYSGYGGATGRDTSNCFGVDGGGGIGSDDGFRGGQNIRGGNGIEWGAAGSGGGGGGGFANFGPICYGGFGGLCGAGGGGGAGYGGFGPAAGSGDGARGVIVIDYEPGFVDRMWVKQGGAWRRGIPLYIKQGGTWKIVRAAWIKSGGSWRKL